MLVRDLAITPEAGAARLSARLDDFELWFRFEAPSRPALRPEPFVAAGLMPAMRQGGALELRAGIPLSPRFREGMDRLQDVWTLWFPALSKVALCADRLEAPPAGTGVASFFSGGVDSGYTFLEHAPEITHLVWFAGMDLRLENEALFRDARDRAAAFARSAGKPLVVLTTNALELMRRHRLAPHMYHGSVVAAIALALAAERVYVAAGVSYAETYPWGTHALTDPLFSTEVCEIVHDGAALRRSEKLRRIAESPALLRALRVCTDGTAYNCGTCDKCLRTRVALRLLGLSSPVLPPLASAAPLAAVGVWNESQFACWRDNYELALRVGDREIASALGRPLRRYRVRRALRELADAIVRRKATP